MKNTAIKPLKCIKITSRGCCAPTACSRVNYKLLLVLTAVLLSFVLAVFLVLVLIVLLAFILVVVVLHFLVLLKIHYLAPPFDLIIILK